MRVIILFLLLIITISAQEADLKQNVSNCVTKEQIVIDTTTNEGRVIKVLMDSGYSVSMQQIMLAQAKYESGNFRNQLSKKWNNVFSMLHSKKDPYSKGNWGKAEGRSGYAVYNSVEESVLARLWYSRKWKYPKDNVSVEEYVRHMKSKGYFTGNLLNYINGMNELINHDAYLFENKSVTIACN